MRIVYSVIVEGRSKAHKPEQERRESFSENERIFLTRNSEAVSAVGAPAEPQPAIVPGMIR